jgi:hypothetical protein
MYISPIDLSFRTLHPSTDKLSDTAEIVGSTKRAEKMARRVSEDCFKRDSDESNFRMASETREKGDGMMRLLLL